MRKVLSHTLFALVIPLVFHPAAGRAQTIDGNIVGLVADATGAAIPDAAIELENMATGIKVKTTSDNGGSYRFNT